MQNSQQFDDIEYFNGIIDSIPSYRKMSKYIDWDAYDKMYRAQASTNILKVNNSNILYSDPIYSNQNYIAHVRLLSKVYNKFFDRCNMHKIVFSVSNKKLKELSKYSIGYDLYRYKNIFIEMDTEYVDCENFYKFHIMFIPGTPILNDLYDFFKEFKLKRDEDKSTVYFVMLQKNSFILEEGIDYSKEFTKLNFDYYNDDFKPEYNNLINELNKPNNKGLYFLQGVAGSGKTTIIRHLTTKIKDRKIIFLPSNLAHMLSDPGFLSFVYKECKDAIIIIEDCEKILTDRMINDTNAVPSLLNISDGLLGDLLNISIICTFNTKQKNIDDALMRKGRAKFNYTFKELSLDKAQKINPAITKPMSLVDCLMFEEKSLIKEKNKIGFQNN